MDVDEDSINKYDEYIHRPVREVITVETPIKPTNKGFAMLAKLGWVQGQPLGLSGQGMLMLLLIPTINQIHQVVLTPSLFK